jgi:DNA polymerase elongation subunit (family B)
MNPKVLLYDIETAPNLSYTWGKYEQDVIAFEQESYILSFSAKWLGGKQITKGLCDYPNYRPGKANDKALVTELYNLIDQADIVIAHNGDRFDIKKMNGRFLYHGLTPPAPYKTVDTLKVARRYFALNSNKLDDLGELLDVGRKVKHPGFELWLGCMNGDPKAWDLMKRYNKQDVILLEAVYEKLKPWIQNHPTPKDGLVDCPNCHSTHFQKRGMDFSRGTKYQRAKCQDCGTNFQIRHEDTSQVS